MFLSSYITRTNTGLGTQKSLNKCSWERLTCGEKWLLGKSWKGPLWIDEDFRKEFLLECKTFNLLWLDEALAGFTLVSLIYEINDLAKQCDKCRHLGKWIISRDQGRVWFYLWVKKTKEGSICGSWGKVMLASSSFPQSSPFYVIVENTKPPRWYRGIP